MRNGEIGNDLNSNMIILKVLYKGLWWKIFVHLNSNMIILKGVATATGASSFLAFK